MGCCPHTDDRLKTGRRKDVMPFLCIGPSRVNVIFLKGIVGTAKRLNLTLTFYDKRHGSDLTDSLF